MSRPRCQSRLGNCACAWSGRNTFRHTSIPALVMTASEKGELRIRSPNDTHHRKRAAMVHEGNAVKPGSLTRFREADASTLDQASYNEAGECVLPWESP